MNLIQLLAIGLVGSVILAFSMANLGGFINSILTPPGTNQLNSQISMGKNVAKQAAGLVPGAVGYDQQAQTYATQNLPQQEQGIQNDYYNTTQGGRNAQVANFQQGANANAKSAAAGAYSQFAGNPALAQGYGLSSQNQANENTAAYANQVNSPQAQSAAWGNYMNAAQGMVPNYGNVATLASTIYGQPKQPVGQGLGSVLGQALGAYLGGGMPGLGGGGGGGAASDGSGVNYGTPSSGGYGFGVPDTSGDFPLGINPALM